MRIVLRSVMLLAAFALVGQTVQGALVGHWTFDEGSGTTAYDSSGKGYNGTIVGATYTTDAQIGSDALQ